MKQSVIFSFDCEGTGPNHIRNGLKSKSKKGVSVEGELVFDNGSSWKGEVNDKHVPHGKGVWKYKDLTIATEAVNGKPIFNMTIEEYYLFQEDNLRVRFEGLI